MKIRDAFKNENNRILNLYITAGFPKLDSLKTILEAMNDTAVDMVEVGIPYSDPISDGDTIQKSSKIALENGINIKEIFRQLQQTSVDYPLIIMAYFNTVFQFGVEAFCRECQSVGVSALILPDLPIDIYLKDYKSIFEKYGISNVFLITPETKLERLKHIDENSTAFIYAVTSSSTTGSKSNVSEAETYLSKLKGLKLKTPILAGFNIAVKKDFDLVNQYTNGGIIGSAFIKHLSHSTDLTTDIKHFIASIKPKS